MFTKHFPGLAQWVDDWGWIEIGRDEVTDSLVRVMDEGGLVWENPGELKSLEKAMQVANEFVRKWIKENE